ncbi:MAG: S8/S53 family peptidase [Bacteroidota bacterium]
MRIALLFFLLANTYIHGQVKSVDNVSFIFQLAPAYQLETVSSAFNYKKISYTCLSKRNNIFLMEGPSQQLNENALKACPGVVQIQKNHSIEFRSLPNDPWINEQWALTKIGMDRVWEQYTDGTTIYGDTIVVAILDSGFDTNHEDLLPNFWRNWSEQPNDGIDNDNNGYVDDLMGWNFSANSAEFRPDAHGTSVAGLIGAVGNNGKGISGMNWNVKLMLFEIDDVAGIVSAYDYIVDQRNKYNQSQGQEGAFVVATNASFGRNSVFCSEEPIWGSMYNQLYEVGVLTAVGVSNTNVDIDIAGDVPASCPEASLINVLNTLENDTKASNSSFGRRTVHLGAPGDNSYSTKPFNQYGGFNDNSASAPHVTGLIALLYSNLCLRYEQEAYDNPTEIAQLVKEAIISGTDQVEGLQNLTISGGRINAFRSMQLAERRCDAFATTPIRIDKVYPNPASQLLKVEYLYEINGEHEISISNTLGQVVWKKSLTSNGIGHLQIQDIDISQLDAGVYILSITAEQLQRKLYKKFIKTN